MAVFLVTLVTLVFNAVVVRGIYRRRRGEGEREREAEREREGDGERNDELAEVTAEGAERGDSRPPPPQFPPGVQCYLRLPRLFFTFFNVCIFLFLGLAGL